MDIIAFDTETFLITPGLLAPPLVCVSFCENDSESYVMNRYHGTNQVRELLESDCILVGHNVVYDFAVLCAHAEDLIPLVFKAYEDGRIRDTRIRQKIFDLADGTMRWENDENGKPKKKQYSLAALALKHLGKFLAKENTWRLKYDQLVDVPLEKWPRDAIDYAKDDAKTTFEVYQHQNAVFKANKPYLMEGDLLRNEREQAKAAWGLHLMSVWGLRTDATTISKLKSELEIEAEKYRREMIDAGLVRLDYTKDTSAIQKRVEQAYGDRPISKTQKGAIQTTAAVLKESGDEVLEHLVTLKETCKLLEDFLPKIELGTKVPLNPSYDELVASGRTSSYGPNIQQMPRKHGIRDCFVPRSGFVFIGADFALLEMVTLGQICLDVFGYSNIAQALNQDRDPHLMVAAQLLGMSYEESVQRKKEHNVKETRQLAKVANYGLGGGMIPPTFVAYAAGYGVKITVRQAEEVRKAWFANWIEMKEYFGWVSSLLGTTGEAELKQIRSERVRFVDSFTVACNTFFQGLAADGAKEAVFRVSKESYVDTKSPLYGCRPVAFIHDEILCEAPAHRASPAADRLAKVMVESMKVYTPDVLVKADPFVMTRWIKGAESVRNEHGELVACT